MDLTKCNAITRGGRPCRQTHGAVSAKGQVNTINPDNGRCMLYHQDPKFANPNVPNQAPAAPIARPPPAPAPAPAPAAPDAPPPDVVAGAFDELGFATSGEVAALKEEVRRLTEEVGRLTTLVSALNDKNHYRLNHLASDEEIEIGDNDTEIGDNDTEILE